MKELKSRKLVIEDSFGLVPSSSTNVFAASMKTSPLDDWSPSRQRKEEASTR